MTSTHTEPAPMNTVTLRLAPETEEKLRAKADPLGLTVASYIERLAEEAARNGATQEAVTGLVQWDGVVIESMSRREVYADVG